MNLETLPPLGNIVRDPGHAGRVMTIVSRVAAARSPPQALEVLHEAKTEMGVDQAVFVSYIRDEDSHESYRFLLAADPRWCFEYQAHAWYGSDPWLIYASQNIEVISASMIALVTAQQREIRALAEKYGMVSVCIAPASSIGSNPRVGMLALGSAQSGFFTDEMAFGLFKLLAHSLAMELHLWSTRYERNELINELRLSDEDLSLLRLELHGAGTKQACGELGASSASIDSRWQRLNRKLSSPHRHASARLAAKIGVI
ncbi:MAG: autoinducer binding domain-containing protein [Burkholderiaceae bacterium]|nr:autoinducer binding domain-containing protein [Burkholderiaceae bacterium]